MKRSITTGLILIILLTIPAFAAIDVPPLPDPHAGDQIYLGPMLIGGSTTDLELVYNYTGEKANWISRHSLLFGGLIGAGIYLWLFITLVTMASQMD